MEIKPSSTLELLFKRQVIEPTEEISIKKDIPRLSPIKDTTSIAVKEQYEENPYPRWVNIKLEVNPLGIKEFVSKTELRIANEIDLLHSSDIDCGLWNGAACTDNSNQI